MTDFFAGLQYFQFIRPVWLLLIPVALLLWWRIRSRATAGRDVATGLPPHLANALKIGGRSGSRLIPIDGVVITIVLLALAAAGPTWSRVPNPLVAQTAPLAVALNASDSMLSTDVPPSRLERAKHKILDIVTERTGARTALIAYAGSTHRVVPMTEDPAVLKPFLEGLSPDIMPSDGRNATAALAFANATLAAETVPGAILFVLDELDRADVPAFEAHAAGNGPRVVFLAIGATDAARADLERIPGAAVVDVTPDRTDIAEIDRQVASAYREALAQDDQTKWEDRGWILVWPAALLTLFWFRRGWTMRWSVLLFAILLGVPGGPARADGLRDWFLTPDQQGRLAYQDKRYAEAAEVFEDPMWQGQALYRAGKYNEAAEVFARLPTADAAFAEGVASVKGREYRPGIAAFEKTLERDPDHAAAARNLEITRAILDYVETSREQSDTGEESGIGADDVVFDNESGRGAETRITGETELQVETAEQWMRTVDTRTEDFLRTRFALEAARGQP